MAATVEDDSAAVRAVVCAAFGWASDVDFCEWLAREVGVAAVPGSSFFREPVRNLIRFHFAKRQATLVAAGERLLKLPERARAGARAQDRRSV